MSSDTIVARQSAGEQSARAKYRNIYAWATLDHEWRNGASTRRDRLVHRPGEPPPGRGQRARRSAPRACATSGCSTSSGCASRTASTPACSSIASAPKCGGCGATTTTPAKCTCCRAFRFRDRRDSTRRARPSRRREGYESSGYWDVRARAGRALGRAGRRRASTRRPTTAPTTASNGARASSVLYTLSPQTQLRASVGRFVQFQGINELQVEDGVDTFYPAQHAYHCDPRLRSCLRRRPRPASGSVPQGLSAHQSALREHLRSAGAAAGSGVRPRADRAGRAPARPASS